MNKIIIKSPFPCLVKLQTEEAVLQPYESLVLDSPFVASIYPLEKAISFVLSSEHLSSCEFFDCTNFEDKVLVCLKSQASCESFDIVKLGGCRLEIGQRKFSVENGTWKKTLLLPCTFEKYQTSIKNDILLVKFSGQTQMLYAFNLKTSHAKAFCGKQIILNNDGFKVDEAAFKISAQGLHEGENEACKNFPTETAAYHFLHFIKKAQLGCAHELLDEKLQKSISKSALKAFFGKVKDFFFLSPKCYAVQNENGLKIYRFEIEQGKIIDISGL